MKPIPPFTMPCHLPSLLTAAAGALALLLCPGCSTGDNTLTLSGAKSFVTYPPSPSSVHIDASAAIEVTHTFAPEAAADWRQIANANQRMALHRQAVAEVLKDDIAQSGLFARIVAANGKGRPDFTVRIRSELRHPAEERIRITMSLHDGRSGAELWSEVGEETLAQVSAQRQWAGSFSHLMTTLKTDLGKYLQRHPGGKPATTTPLPAHGYIGVEFRNATAEEARSGNLPDSRGVLITRVVAPGPAAAAALPEGAIIVALDDQVVANAAGFVAQCRELSPGQKINMRFAFHGRVQTAVITADALPPAMAHFQRGVQRREDGDYIGAISDFAEVIRLDPSHAAAYLNRGIAKASGGKFGEAFADYNEALHLNPTYALAYLNRGAAKAYEGDYAGAIPDYTEAIRLTPTDTRAYARRAAARASLGDEAGALQDRAKASELEAKATAARLQTTFAQLALPDMLAASDPDVTTARARNRAIIAAKTTHLPGLLRDTKTDDLTALVVKIEQIVLDLNHEAEMAKDRAQQALAAGGEAARGADDLRERAITYRERIELLKPIAAAIKDELANRNR